MSRVNRGAGEVVNEDNGSNPLSVKLIGEVAFGLRATLGSVLA